ncbi:MAG: Uma2 family endonuclease, partial [Flavisolibacter sp.]|nr:Uma2 family endonuclease [Flavisolibacter sp.]
MAEPALQFITAEKYLELERAATEKHEFYQGEVFVRPGATVKHNTIQINFVGEVRNFLKGKPCQVFGSDLRVHI